MQKLSVFNNITLDGFFTDLKGDYGWTQKSGDNSDFNAFVADNAKDGGILLLGRKTYDIMAGFWPTPMAASMMPMVAEKMNSLPKIVFSRTLESAAWSNTTVMNGEILAQIRALKSIDGPGMTILGSGSIAAQFAAAGLIDEYQVVINPVAIGGGRSMFGELPSHLNLKLTDSRTFSNGNVWLKYEPAG